jgi:hypothetical protein
MIFKKSMYSPFNTSCYGEYLMKRRLPCPMLKGFKWLFLSLALVFSASSFAASGEDPITQVENYLDQIRARVDAIQQSVGGVEDPPLVEQVAETMSLKACASLSQVAAVGLGGEFKLPVKASGKAEPGAYIVSALIGLNASLQAIISGSLDATPSLSGTVCLDLTKITKVLLENALLQVEGEPVGLLGDISQDARDYLLALAYANPADVYNLLLETGVGGVNEAFGFNPEMITDAAYLLDEAIRESEFSDDPEVLLTNVEAGLDTLGYMLPFAGVMDLDFRSIFDDPEVINPCTYKELIPFGPMNECDEFVDDIDVALADVVDVLNNLLDLFSIENAVYAASTTLNFIKNTSLSAIEWLIDELHQAKEDMCDVLYPVIICGEED